MRAPPVWGLVVLAASVGVCCAEPRHSRSCLCSVDGTSNGESIAAQGCGIHGLDSKWCFVGGPGCDDDDVHQLPPSGGHRNASWRPCDGHRCLAFYSLPELQYEDLIMQKATAEAAHEDWPSCCAECSRSEACAAWRFTTDVDGGDYQCDVFLGPAADVAAAQGLAAKLVASAVAFPTAVSPQERYIYGVPGIDDGPRTCLGRRREAGQCISFVPLLPLSGVLLLAAFCTCCCPWARDWAQFARAVRNRGVLVQCHAKPERVRHEWQWDEGAYRYEPIFEVKLSWEQPAGMQREMINTGVHETDHLFDGKVGALAKRGGACCRCCRGPALRLRVSPRSLYMLSAGEPCRKPAEGVWSIECPSHWPSTPRSVGVVGLVDEAHPDLVLSLERSRDDVSDVLRPLHGLSFCLCGCLALLPFLVAAALWLQEPLLAGEGVPVFLLGYDESLTRSHFAGPVSTEGRWTSAGIRRAARVVLAAGVFLCCAQLGWLCYARCLLSNVRGASYSASDDELAEEVGKTFRVFRASCARSPAEMWAYA